MEVPPEVRVAAEAVVPGGADPVQHAHGSSAEPEPVAEPVLRRCEFDQMGPAHGCAIERDAERRGPRARVDHQRRVRALRDRCGAGDAGRGQDGCARTEHDRQRDRERTHPSRMHGGYPQAATGAAEPTTVPGTSGSGRCRSPRIAPIVEPGSGSVRCEPDHVNDQPPHVGFCNFRSAASASAGTGVPVAAIRLDHQRRRVRVRRLEAPRVPPAVSLCVADLGEERERVGGERGTSGRLDRLHDVRRRVGVGVEEVLRRTQGVVAMLVVVRRGRLVVLPAAVGTLGVHQPLHRGIGHGLSGSDEGDHRERIVEDGGLVEPPVSSERIDDRLDEVQAAERSWIATRGDDRGHDLRLEPDAVGLSVGDASPEEPERLVQLVLADPGRDEREHRVGGGADRGEGGDGTVGSLLRCQVRDRVIDAVGVIPPFRPRDRGRYDERCDDS